MTARPSTSRPGLRACGRRPARRSILRRRLQPRRSAPQADRRNRAVLRHRPFREAERDTRVDDDAREHAQAAALCRARRPSASCAPSRRRRSWRCSVTSASTGSCSTTSTAPSRSTPPRRASPPPSSRAWRRSCARSATSLRSSRPFLDRGAWGVQVPHVNTADEARAAVDAVKYGPEGHRGIFQRRPTGRLRLQGRHRGLCPGSQPPDPRVPDAGGSRGHREPARDWSRCPGWTCISSGPVTFRNPWGYTGQQAHPEVQQADGAWRQDHHRRRAHRRV